MGLVDQFRLKSGFDVEALLSERYIQILLQTAFDAGLIPAEETIGGTRLVMHMLSDSVRTYPSNPYSDDTIRPTAVEAFKTTLLFDHPTGANLKVRIIVGPEGFLPFVCDLLLGVALDTTDPEQVAVRVGVVDIESGALATIESQYMITKAQILAKLQEAVDRSISLGSASKFKQVEDIQIRWFPADADHAACVGLYINIVLRNGDEEDQFLPPRGDISQALNFLPSDEDIAMASRPGLYPQIAKHVYSLNAVPLPGGGFEHALRKNPLKPTTDRLGDLHSISVGVIPPNPNTPLLIPNGLRFRLTGDYQDPVEFTNTDLTYRIDLLPRIDADGGLGWTVDLDIDVDALFEFITLWAVVFIGALLGPYGALIALGVVFLAEIGVGIGVTLYKEGSVREKGLAALADVIPDRLPIAIRRWDPFYATIHQVVTLPSQAQFNAAGFMLCGKAAVGRQLVPPVEMVIRDEVRDSAGTIVALRYRIPDHEKVMQEAFLVTPGSHRRGFTLADDAEPDLWTLTLEEIEARRTDPEGPLVISRIPYFPSAVHIKNNQIHSMLCLSAQEITDIQDALRKAHKDAEEARLRADDLPAITQEAMTALGGSPTAEELEAEINTIIKKRLAIHMDAYSSPEPLDMALDGTLAPHLRLDLAPEEWIDLQKRGIVLMDGAVRTIKGTKVMVHLRDHTDWLGSGPGTRDNLLNRPRYKPSPAGPVFA